MSESSGFIRTRRQIFFYFFQLLIKAIAETVIMAGQGWDLNSKGIMKIGYTVDGYNGAGMLWDSELGDL